MMYMQDWLFHEVMIQLGPVRDRKGNEIGNREKVLVHD
jgi:hypothetical protein